MAGKSYLAGGTIRVSRFVKGSTAANFTVLEADANEKIFGISQEGSRVAPIPSVTVDPAEAAQSGEQVEVHSTDDRVVMLEIGTGGCTADDYLVADADGKGVVSTGAAGAEQHVGARALETASAGDLARVSIHIETVPTASHSTIADPGDAGAIPVTRSGSVGLVTAGAETRTLAIPTFEGQQLSVGLTTDGGDAVITAATGVNQTGNTSLTFADAGDHLKLEGVYLGVNLVWRVVANDGVALA